jgi:hypothetical protein
MTKEIYLTKGYKAIVDDCDFEWLNEINWCACENKNTVYALHSFKNKDTGKHEMIAMHRLILGVTNKFKVDHVDRDGLNNTRENLRYCTHADNDHNMGVKRKNNTTGYKGISFYPEGIKDKPFTAHIGFHGKLHHIGYFETDIEAAKAYDEKAKELFGEFACLNFPE